MSLERDPKQPPTLDPASIPNTFGLRQGLRRPLNVWRHARCERLPVQPKGILSLFAASQSEKV